MLNAKKIARAGLVIAFLFLSSVAEAQVTEYQISDSATEQAYYNIDYSIPNTGEVFQPVSFGLKDSLKGIVKKDREKRERWLTPSGWMEIGHSWNSSRPASGRNGPIGFNDQHNQFQLNQLYLVLEASQGEDDNESWSWDTRIDLLFGTDHDYTVASGLEIRTDGSQRWNRTPDPATDDFRGTPANPRPYYGLSMPQLYADLHTPLLFGMDLRLGHFYSQVGYESVMPLENFFYTHTMSRMHGQPFTHTGALASTTIVDALDIRFGITRGWDNWEDDSEGDLSITGGVGWSMDDSSFDINFHSGDDFIGMDNGGNTLVGNVTIVTLTYTRNLSEKMKHVLTADIGHGDAMQGNTLTGGLAGARWYGITNYWTYAVGEKLSTGVRVEWFRDQDNSRIMPGAFSSNVNGGNYVNVSLGLNYQPNERWMFRPEARWDWSDTMSSDLSVPGAFGDFQENDTFTLSFDAIFSF